MNTYLLFKSLHLLAVISWMAGLLYLPRIFVYHSENTENMNSSNIFKIMEKTEKKHMGGTPWEMGDKKHWQEITNDSFLTTAIEP